MVANGQSGNNYGHTMQHGLGSYHNHQNYEGTASYVLGQASYCQMTRDHVAANDHSGGWNGDVLLICKEQLQNAEHHRDVHLKRLPSQQLK